MKKINRRPRPWPFPAEFGAYYGVYANAHRARVRKASLNPLVLRMAEEDIRRVPSKGWAA